MNIIHYNLGLPPLRSGGLTKYSIDIALEQSKENIVSILYPRGLHFATSKREICLNKTFESVVTYTIKNAVPVPLLHGIKNPKSLLGGTNTIATKNLESFFESTRPDIFHIHTLMGLPIELILFLRQKGTKIVFSSHDYYGLCMRVNFINNVGIPCDEASATNCAACNSGAPSNLFLHLRNSSWLVANLKKIKTKYLKNTKYIPSDVKVRVPSEVGNQRITNNYQELIDYYKYIYSLIDIFIFNSQVSQEVYKRNLKIKNERLIFISHKDIIDNRVEKEFINDEIRLTFIGNLADYKGFPLLKRVLQQLSQKGIKNWTLDVWGNHIGIDADLSKIRYKGKYSSNQVKDVYSSTDLLIVPSICKETFSLSALEALSFGVPVLVSSNVGAKGIVAKYNTNFIYDTEADIERILSRILKDVSVLKEYNNSILTQAWDYSFEKHVCKILDLYKEISHS